ncbi:MAG: hypothetical protein RJQ04_11145 [Longimicrobiales bacterium]
MTDERRGRRKLGGLVLEAAMVVFAVLVALAVDEWREGRQRADLVDRARAAIEAELRANQAELAAGGPTVASLHAAVDTLVRGLRAGRRDLSWEIQADIPDFSDAAWQTARATGIMAHMDYPWVLQIARVYETQDLAGAAQNGLLDALGRAVVRPPELERAQDLQGSLYMALQVYANLTDRYRELFGDAPGP